MKKTALIMTIGLIANCAIAQNAKYVLDNTQNTTQRVPFVAPPILNKKSIKPQPVTAAKTTASTFWGPETFGSGTASSLPTGWTANSLPFSGSSTWKWANTASTSTFTMGMFNSTTAADGWMIFDSDLIGAASGGTPSGYLQTPLINACATESSVRLNFQNYFRNFYDSCSVWVCNNASFTPGTYQVYPVVLNNTLAVNLSTDNPSQVQINISPSAAMQSDVYIRFVYYGYAGGSYSWMIDDINLSDMDPVDIALDKSSTVYYGGAAAGFSSFGAKPIKMMDTVYPVTFATNYGTTGFPAATVNAKIFQGTTSVYDNNVNVNLPVNAVDTIADFVNVGTPAGYYATANSVYTVPFAVNMTGDAVTANNYDTTTFAATDSVWSENTPNARLTGGAFVYRTSTPPLMSFSPATGFVVTGGRTDTLTSVSVAFDDNTTPGQVVGVQIFHFDGSNWLYDGVTQFRALTAEEISTTSTVRYASFKVDADASGGNIILSGGPDGTTYAAVLKGQNNTADVVVLQSTPPAPNSIVGYVGFSDTSFNDGASSQQFGQDGLPFANSSVPLINLNFGPVPEVSIKDVTNSFIAVTAYPNPATDELIISFSGVTTGDVTVTLTNMLGQIVTTNKFSNTNNGKVTFNTKKLPAGIYYYTVSTEGDKTNGQVVIMH